MTEILDEARKYVGLYKESMNRHDTEGSIMYGLRAMNILTLIEDTSRNKEEIKDAESVAKEMLSTFYDNTDLSEYKRRSHCFY